LFAVVESIEAQIFFQENPYSFKVEALMHEGGSKRGGVLSTFLGQWNCCATTTEFAV
jgi:hypothetical protein